MAARPSRAEASRFCVVSGSQVATLAIPTDAVKTFGDSDGQFRENPFIRAVYGAILGYMRLDVLSVSPRTICVHCYAKDSIVKFLDDCCSVGQANGSPPPTLVWHSMQTYFNITF